MEDQEHHTSILLTSAFENKLPKKKKTNKQTKITCKLPAHLSSPLLAPKSTPKWHAFHPSPNLHS
jgi:hypothetical protein